MYNSPKLVLLPSTLDVFKLKGISIIILLLAKLYDYDHQSIPATNLFNGWSAFSVSVKLLSFMKKTKEITQKTILSP